MELCMRLAAAAATVVALLALCGDEAYARSGAVNTRFDSGLNWYLDRPAADAPVYPGFHGSLGFDAIMYGRLHMLFAGSIEAYRYGAEQKRDQIFILRAGPMGLPIDFQGGTGWVEASAGYASVHGMDSFALVGGLGYMAHYGRLGIGLFSRYTQILMPSISGDDIKALVFGVSAGVALVRPPVIRGGSSVQVVEVDLDDDGDGDGVPNARDRCPHTPPDTRVDKHGCEREPRLGTAEVEETSDEGPRKPAPEFQDPAPPEPPPATVVNLAPRSPPAPPVVEPPPDEDPDRDGVPDPMDACPGTTPGFPVDVLGCATLRRRFALPSVTFARFTARPTKEAYVQLEELMALLRTRPGARVKITAYVENANEQPLRVLSRVAQQRATWISELLVARGIPAKRVRAVGARRPDINEIEVQVSGRWKVAKPRSSSAGVAVTAPMGPAAPLAPPPLPVAGAGGALSVTPPPLPGAGAGGAVSVTPPPLPVAGAGGAPSVSPPPMVSTSRAVAPPPMGAPEAISPPVGALEPIAPPPVAAPEASAPPPVTASTGNAKTR
jgi:hypothetical protein